MPYFASVNPVDARACALLVISGLALLLALLMAVGAREPGVQT
jgi:hypothetical protein